MCLDEWKDSGALPPDTMYSLKDILVWREEEMLASEILASILRVPHYILGVWLDPQISITPLEVAFTLMFEPWKKKAYISYPISDAQSKPGVWEKVVKFRGLTRSYLAAFGPLTISEKRLHGLMLRSRQGDPQAANIVCDVRGTQLQIELQEIESIIPDIDGQIVARDYKLIDQSDMIIAYFPVDENGSPLIAGGVQSEIEHAVAATKEVVIVWESTRDPTPFIGKK